MTGRGQTGEELEDFVALWLGPARPADTLMVSGAGLSTNRPTSLPTGAALLRRVFDLLFATGTLDAIVDIHGALGLKSTGVCDPHEWVRPPRLETVLGVAVDAHGLGTAMSALADFADAPPNDLHRVLAAHVQSGGRHITANFDDCIERAGPLSIVGQSAIWHFHGSLADDPSGASLRATLRSIEAGFDIQDAQRLRDTFLEHERAVVGGYSGSDFFDVDPALAEFGPTSLAGRSVLWVAHHKESHWSQRVPNASDPQSLRLLHQAGAEVTVLCADTSRVLSAIAAAWQLEAPSKAASTDNRNDTNPEGSVSPEARSTATFTLMRRLGLHSEVAVRLDDPVITVDPVERFRAVTDILWERGQFASARRMWHHAPADVPAWERAERIGACLWEQGRLVPAYMWLRRQGQVANEGSPERLRLAETTARVVLRMLRSPDTRWLGRRLVGPARAEFDRATQRDGVGMFRRVHDVVEQLDAYEQLSVTAGDARISGEWFLEAGDVPAVLAYRHTVLRRTYRDDLPTTELSARYRRLQADKERVGSAGSRVLFLPGAERVYSVGEFLSALFDSQFAPWHRVRLLTGYLLGRISYRMHLARRRV